MKAKEFFLMRIDIELPNEQVAFMDDKNLNELTDALENDLRPILNKYKKKFGIIYDL